MRHATCQASQGFQLLCLSKLLFQLLRLNRLGTVARNLRDADDLAAPVADGRDSQPNRLLFARLRNPNRFEVVQGLAPGHHFPDLFPFLAVVSR